MISDKWKGYTPLKKEFTKLKQVASDEGKNFKELHIHIMNIKGWLRGIRHPVKAFFYELNREILQIST